MGEWRLLLVRKDINALIRQVPMKIAVGADAGPFPGSFALQVGYILVSKKRENRDEATKKSSNSHLNCIRFT